MTYIPHDQQEIQDWEAEEMAKPFKKFCAWILSPEGKKHIKKVAEEIMKGKHEDRDPNGGK